MKESDEKKLAKRRASNATVVITAIVAGLLYYMKRSAIVAVVILVAVLSLAYAVLKIGHLHAIRSTRRRNGGRDESKDESEKIREGELRDDPETPTKDHYDATNELGIGH